MTYMKGYEDGINAVLDVIRGWRDSAKAQAQDTTQTLEDREYANTLGELLNITHEDILKHRKHIIAMRKQQLELLSGRTH